MLSALTLLSASVVAQCQGGVCSVPAARPQVTVQPQTYTAYQYQAVTVRYVQPIVGTQYVIPRAYAPAPVYYSAPVFAPVYSSPCAGGACRR